MLQLALVKLTTKWSFSVAYSTNCFLKAFSFALLVHRSLSITYTPLYRPAHSAMNFQPTVFQIYKKEKEDDEEPKNVIGKS